MGEEVIVVAGGGGFIGAHLTQRLLESGARVRCVDYRPLDDWCQLSSGAENLVLDLRLAGDCVRALEGADQVYNFACDMGGVGFLDQHKALCMLSVLINTHLLQAAVQHGLSRYFYASSACVYAADRQLTADARPLVEADAYPADPEDGYGWEKLFSERMCRHFREDFGLPTRVARFHNVYGPHGAWFGGREKAPAAICRKVAEAVISGRYEIEIWGDGEQTRSFTYIDDCLEGIERIMGGAIVEPLNVGSSEAVTINGLVDLVEEIAGVSLIRHHTLNAPTGVRGRNSDNTKVRELLDWEPTTALREGLEHTYRWVYDQVAATSSNVRSNRAANAAGSKYVSA